MTRFGENQEVTSEELAAIRSLDDFDLTMIVSEIHDHGWPFARRTLVLAAAASELSRQKLRSERA